MFLLISQTGNSWIVQYVIGLLNHLLIYSSQHFLYFKMNLLVENTMWDSMKVEQIFYDALDGSACQGTVREFQKNIYFCFINYAKAFDYGSQ